MPKTYYLGRTAGGAVVARGSGQDYGFTHAAVIGPEKYAAGVAVPSRDMTFSRSAAGAVANAARHHSGRYEVVQVDVVDAATYRAATGKR